MIQQGSRSKYGNKRTEYRGKKYASQREANRAAELDMLKKAGEVASVFEQVPFDIGGGRKYVADFVVLYPEGRYEVEDAKGVRTALYRLKRDLMLEKYGIEIQEV